MVLARRIDALRCTQENAREKAAAISAGITSQAAEVQQEVAMGFDEIIRSLTARKQRMLQEVEQVAQAKLGRLDQQLREIEAGICTPGQAVEANSEMRPDEYLLCTDSVIKFRVQDKQLKDKIESFGCIDERSTYASQSYLRGPLVDDVLKIKNPSWLYVHACDRDGVQCSEGGDRITATVDRPDCFERVEVEDIGDGRYRVTVVPMFEGHYSLEIAIGPEGAAEQTCGSPLTLHVLPPRDYSLICADKLGEVGSPWLSEATGRLRGPSGLTFDPTGRYLLVADQCNDRLQVFDFDSRTTICAFGKKGCGPQELNTPGSIVIDRENRVVVSDILNHRLQVFAFNPSAASLWHMRTVGGPGDGIRQFQFPRGLITTEEGLLYVCDSQNHRVQVFDMNNDFRFVQQIGSEGLGDGQFVMPVGIAVNRDGEILVADSSNRVQIFDAKGSWQRSFGCKGGKEGMFRHISGIVVNNENLLFVCDDGNHRVQVLDAVDGTFVHKWGGRRAKIVEVEQEDEAASGRGSPGPDEEWLGLRKPADIAVHSRGAILVSDYYRHTIYDF